MATTDAWTRIKTTLPRPLPTSAARKPTLTSRLLIRPLAASDLTSLHLLMTQQEVMQWTAAGRAHTSLDETERKLAQFLPPRGDATTFNCAVCLRGAGDGEGELVGIGGVHRFSRTEGLSGVDPDGGYGWPELGYLFKKEVWGMGLATEFVRAFLGMWDGLQRAELGIDVNAKSLRDRDGTDGARGDGGAREDGMMADEMLIAIIDPTNVASRRILDKCGFEYFDGFTETRVQDADRTLALLSFRYFPKSVVGAEHSVAQMQTR